MKILFLVPYPLRESPSQRFRFEQYFEILSKQGHSYQVQSFLDSRNWRIFFNSGNSIEKVVALLKGFLRRFTILLRVFSFDFIFIHREVTPVGPPIFEWIIAKVFRKKIIYDFDDAIWLTDRKDESWWLPLIKWRSKVNLLCSWSYKVSCGNSYLESYAREFNNNVVLNPTTVDTETIHNSDHYEKRNNKWLTIGWTGSHSTLKYLPFLETVLQQLEKNFSFLRFIVIADKPIQLNLKSLVFIPWSLQTEIKDLLEIDIGVMPLPDDEWSKGKCGFKALQYMALQLPVIASSVGVNPQIIDHGIDGFLATTEEEWISRLTQLIEKSELRISLGLNARKKVIHSYSVKSNTKNFLSLFDT